jgi:hypothetical protein
LNKEKNMGRCWVEWDVAQVEMPVIGETRRAEPWLGQGVERLDRHDCRREVYVHAFIYEVRVSKSVIGETTSTPLF